MLVFSGHANIIHPFLKYFNKFKVFFGFDITYFLSYDEEEHVRSTGVASDSVVFDPIFSDQI